METNKKKYNLEIAGMPLTIVTDEPTSFVESIVNRLDAKRNYVSMCAGKLLP